MLRHMPKLITAAQQGNWSPNYSSAVFSGLWGDITDSGHAFSARAIDWGFKLTEPQCTKALAYFLASDGNEALSRSRCTAFVRALYRAAGRTDGASWMNPEKAKPNTLKVEAERLIGQKRVDLALGWEDEGDATREAGRRLILIECKFNHHVTKGQLSAYRRFAHRSVKIDSRELFLVVDRMTSQTTKALQINQEWVPLTWRALIRRLEVELAALGVQVDHDFVRLRRTIWEMSDKKSL